MLRVLIIAIPIAAVAALLFGALRYLLRSWLDYRVRMAVLHALDRHPELLTETVGAEGNAFSTRTPSSDGRVDYLITGIALGVFGVCCLIGGWAMHVGQLAVGMYLGGIFCLCIGLLLGVFGYLGRRMNRGKYASR